MKAGELRPFLPQLVGDRAQHGAGLGPIGVQKGLAQRRRHHALLGFRHMRQSVAHPMHAAALPRRAEHPADRRFQPLMSIRDHQLDPAQAAARQALQKARQKVSASDGPMCSPTISRLPSALTATAIIAATETMRPPSRCFR
jgi:hypothetical protein